MASRWSWTAVVMALVLLFPLMRVATGMEGQDRTLERVRPVLSSTGSERRVALVIGNGDYPDAPLKNPVNDARALAEALQGLGFEVTHRENINQTAMKRAIRAFGEALRQGGVGLFYFAGHGVQVHGRNYLIPIGADIHNEEEVEYEAVDAGRVLAEMENAQNQVNILILDACRNNPFARSFRSASRGLAQMDAPSGTLIAYATAPGRVASDGPGRNGPYAQALLEQMREPGLTVEEVFKRTRVAVLRVTGGEQVPWESSSLVGEFSFSPAQQPGAAASAPPTHPVGVEPLAVELEFWNSIKDSHDPALYQAYLKRYPQGTFADIAQLRLLEAASAASQGAPSASPGSESPTTSIESEERPLTHETSGSVIAVVNGSSLTRRILEVYEKLQRAAKHGTPADEATLIQNLVSLQLLTDDAIQKGLDKDPQAISQLDFQRLNILASADLRQLLTSHKFTDEELKKEYDRLVAAQPRKEYKASHILTKTKAEAKAVIKELDEGKSFAELAKEKSIDPSAKQNSGDLGWFPPQQRVKPFAEAVEKMKKGTYTKTPVQSEFGWHVIKLEDERDVQPPPFEQAKPQVEQILQGKMVNDYVAKLKDSLKYTRGPKGIRVEFGPKCSSGYGSDLVATMRGTCITRQILEVYEKLQRDAKPGTPVDEATLTQNLVSLQLLTDDAIQKGMDKDPIVISQLEFQRLNILASADLRQLLASHKFTDEELKKESDRLVAAQPRKEGLPFEQARAQVEQILQGKMVNDYVGKLRQTAQVILYSDQVSR